jgi:hypothetical protein
MSPQSHALRGAKAPSLASTERSRLRAFAFLAPVLDDMAGKLRSTWQQAVGRVLA